RWYLEKECRIPRYAVCEVFGTHIPSTVSGFLFKPDGLGGRATPEQMDRIRAEESDIVFRAALTYPGTELRNLADHVGRQLLEFGILPVRFGDRIDTDAAGEPVYEDLPDRSSAVISALNLVTDAVIALCALWLLLNVRR